MDMNFETTLFNLVPVLKELTVQWQIEIIKEEITTQFDVSCDKVGYYNSMEEEHPTSLVLRKISLNSYILK